MHYCGLNDAKVGDVLARPVISMTGDILLQSNVQLTPYLISRLNSLDIYGVYIFDDLSEQISAKESLPLDLQLQALRGLHHLNIDNCIYVANKMVQALQDSGKAITDVSSLMQYDSGTYRHSLNVATYSTIVGIKLGLPTVKLEQLTLAALLHDIGKTCIPIEIINKPAKLTDKEYELVQKHSEFGYEILRKNDLIPSTVRVSVYEHHENEDGSGYPRKLSGDRIYLYSKIIHVCDVYDALICKRPYKSRKNPNDVLEYMIANSGHMFDPYIVQKFLKSVVLYPVGMTVHLSDGRKCIVIENHDDYPTRPLCRTMEGEDVNLLDYLDITIIDYAT